MKIKMVMVVLKVNNSFRVGKILTQRLLTLSYNWIKGYTRVLLGCIKQRGASLDHIGKTIVDNAILWIKRILILSLSSRFFSNRYCVKSAITPDGPFVKKRSSEMLMVIIYYKHLMYLSKLSLWDLDFCYQCC